MTGKTGMTSNCCVTTKKFALDFSQQKKDLNAEQKRTAALEHCLREMESVLSAGEFSMPLQPSDTIPPQSKSVSIFGLSTKTDITLSQKFDSQLNLPPTHNDTPANASSSSVADVGRWNQIFSCVPPIASGHRGVGRKPLWRNIYHYPISSELAMHDATTIISLAGPLVWLPISDHTLPLPILTMWTSIQIMTKTTSCITKGTLLPMIAIPIGGTVGTNLKQLAGSACNQRNLIPAPAHSKNAPAHRLLSSSWQSKINAVLPRSRIIGPNLLYQHFRSHNTSRQP
jgi:hypothetical protein